MKSTLSEDGSRYLEKVIPLKEINGEYIQYLKIIENGDIEIGEVAFDDWHVKMCIRADVLPRLTALLTNPETFNMLIPNAVPSSAEHYRIKAISSWTSPQTFQLDIKIKEHSGKERRYNNITESSRLRLGKAVEEWRKKHFNYG